MKKLLIFLSINICLNMYGQENVAETIGIISKRAEEKNLVESEEEKSVRIYNDWFKITSISLYGGGSLLGLVTADSDIEDSASPTGSLGLNFSSNRISSNIFFSYNGRQTVEMQNLSQFGSALMNPNLGGQSFTFSALGRIKNNFGISTSFQIADNLWKLDDETSIDASPMIIRLGLYFKPFDFGNENDDTNSQQNKINLTLNLHYTHRSILGDFNNNDQIIDGNTISSRGYNGLDFSINAYLNSVHLYVQFSRNSKKFEIPGFSGTQVLFGLNVTGNLINIRSEKPK